MYDYTYYDYGTSYDYGYDLGSTVGSVLGGLLIFFVIVSIIALAVSIVQLIGQWKLYKKAGKGGWEAIVPFYCNYVLVEIAGLKWYWFLGFFAPLVFNFIGLGIVGWLAYLFTMFTIFFNLSKKFNKGIGFTICATLFTPICIPILGFSSKEKYDANVAVSPHGVFGSPQSPAQNVAQPTYQQPASQVQPIQDVVNPVQPTVEGVTPVIVPTPQPVEEVKPVTHTVEPESQNTTPAFCTNCGSALMPNSKFCTNCGKQI